VCVRGVHQSMMAKEEFSSPIKHEGSSNGSYTKDTGCDRSVGFPIPPETCRLLPRHTRPSYRAQGSFKWLITLVRKSPAC